MVECTMDAGSSFTVMILIIFILFPFSLSPSPDHFVHNFAYRMRGSMKVIVRIAIHFLLLIMTNESLQAWFIWKFVEHEAA